MILDYVITRLTEYAVTRKTRHL